MKTFFGILLVVFLFSYSSILSFQENDFPDFIRFPLQDSAKINYCQPQVLFSGSEIFIFSSANRLQDTIYISKTSDDGQNWSTPVYVTNFQRDAEELILLSAIISNSGRMLLVYSIGESVVSGNTKFVYSDDNGATWSSPLNVIGTAYIPHPKLSKTIDGKLWIVGRYNFFFYSTDDGNTWVSKSLGFSTSTTTSFDLISLNSINFLMAYDKYNSNEDSYKIYYRKSTDGGNTWSDETIITETNRSEKRPRLFLELDGTILLVTQVSDSTPFTANFNIYQQNISYRKSFNDGNTWSNSTNITNYIGFDGVFNIYEFTNKPLIIFLSDRRYGKNQIWIGQIEVSQDNSTSPVLYRSENSNIMVGAPISIRAFVGSVVGVQQTELLYELNNTLFGPIPMFDDGNHDDYLPGDNIWGVNIGPFNYYDVVNTSFKITDNNSLSVSFSGNTMNFPAAPIENKWMAAGSLHNWYSSVGCEIEHGWVARQQFGMQYPGIYPFQDLQASRGWWVGAENFIDENGIHYPHKVVTVGPRNPQFFPVYPIEFKMYSKFGPTLVKVNGIPTYDKEIEIDEIDETLVSDRMIENIVNTQLGLTMTRKIYQFSQQFNDNYIVYDYTFKNTGNVDWDEYIELPNQTLNDVYFFWTYRNAINQQTRYVIGNNSGWGYNTMNDARGDGVEVDPPDQNFRAQFSWHGFYTVGKEVPYDNIGGPIWEISGSASPYFPDRSDTIGRLGATQFVGTLTLHADKSANDTSDDETQPSTTSYLDSDDLLFLAGANALDTTLMTQRYLYMSSGHQSPRHARLVEPSGDYALQRGEPGLGRPGGFSFNNGYGPYTIGPGEDIRIILIEGVAGMSLEKQIEIGQLFKQGVLSDEQKDREVMKSRDSLFQTFRRGIENYQSGWNIPQPPNPPITFDVNSLSNRILLSWTIDENDPNPPAGFNVYRTQDFYFRIYERIAELPSDARSFTDSNLTGGTSYFYYLACVGPEQSGGPGTPAGKLESSRYYTQTYDPVSIPTGIDPDETLFGNYNLLQNYPNPFNPVTNFEFQIKNSGTVSLKIYDILGNEVATIVNEELTAGTYKYQWVAGKYASGVYFYKLQAEDFVDTKKLILMK